MQPIIGMFVAIDQDRTAHALHDYAHAIEQCGALPLIIPYLQNKGSFARLTALCDGFCFTGGVDVAPVHYGEEKSPFCGEIQEHRDALEFRIFEMILPTGKPILGICRGFQMVNVACGGTLYQDLKIDYGTDIQHRMAEPFNRTAHRVTALPGTPLAALLGSAPFEVNSVHHQGAKVLGKGLEAMAVSEDGIVEAVYMPERRFVWAVQWHPEWYFKENAESAALIKAFVDAASDLQ